MKFLQTAAVAASILSSSSGLAAARAIIISPDALEIAVLGGQTFRVPQTLNPAFITGVGRGPRAMARTMAKYGLAIPLDLLQLLEAILEELGLIPSANGRPGSGLGSGSGRGGNSPFNSNQSASAAQGEVAAIPQMFDSEYLAEVSIGTPPQTLMLNFDTGSSDLWVFSTETPRAMTRGQELYDMSSSSTSQRLPGATWNITYGDGSGSSGNVYLDTVSVGGVTVQNQAVESATRVSAQFTNDSASSGLLGLAMNGINQIKPTPQKTFFSNAMENLAMPLFTANLKQAEAGNYNFGFIDRTEFTGDISFVEVNATRGFWEFEADGFMVGQGASATMVDMPHLAIADTGTTLLLVPEDMSRAYYAQVPSAQNSTQLGGFVFDCTETLPALTLALGDYMAVVPGELINFAPAGQGLCFGGLQSMAGLPFAIYGDVFLKSQFVVFMGAPTPQLGFASKPL